MTSERKSILVVEDEPEIARLVELHLTDAGFDVQRAPTGGQALRTTSLARPALVILDLMLPDMDGIEVCHHLRRQKDYTPILMLTAKSSEVDRVLGLEVGADDYMVKPFSVRELVARVKAIFRRLEALGSGGDDEDEVIRIGDLTIDPMRHAVLRQDEPVHLTAKEFDLLLQFARHPGRVYTRAELLDRVWGYAHDGYEHTVNTHINRLRSKIERNPANPRHILTVWGVGYKCAEPEDASGEESRP